MRLGAMRHKIEFVAIGEIRGAMGGVSEGETSFAFVRAEIKPISGGERFMSNQLFAEATSQIKCRFVAGITRKHKIKFGTRTFDILDMQNKDEKSVELFIVAKEIL